MDQFLFEVLETVASEGSFSRAGQKLYRSQPAISLAIKRLEDNLGQRLLDRSSRRAHLTDAGAVALRYAKRFRTLEHELRSVLTDLDERRAGKLTIGANESTALYLLGHVEAYRRRYPGIEIELRRSLSSAIPEAVLQGDLEMGAISYDPGNPRLRVFRLYKDRLAFVVSPEHRLARRTRISIEELGGETFIAHNVESPYRDRVIETFRRHQVRLNMAVEMPTVETIRWLVQRNVGVSFLPLMCLEQELRTGALREVVVRELGMERTVRLVHPAERSLARAAQAFLDLAEEQAEASPEAGDEGGPL